MLNVWIVPLSSDLMFTFRSSLPLEKLLLGIGLHDLVHPIVPKEVFAGRIMSVRKSIFFVVAWCLCERQGWKGGGLFCFVVIKQSTLRKAWIMITGTLWTRTTLAPDKSYAGAYFHICSLLMVCLWENEYARVCLFAKAGHVFASDWGELAKG